MMGLISHDCAQHVLGDYKNYHIHVHRQITLDDQGLHFHDLRGTASSWGYHILGTLRLLMSWGVSEGWLAANPALNVKMKSPPKRTVQWEPKQAATYMVKATELGWHSIAAMAQVFDSTAQSPVDVRTLKRGNYDGRAISNTRTKTGVTDAPIPLFPEAKAALDAYLATKPATRPKRRSLPTPDGRGMGL
jgi:integrase